MPVAVRRLLILLAVAGAGLVPVPASAAGYCTGSGVSVVVDFGAIGGGVEKGCGSGSTAADVFRSAGVGLTRDQQYPAVVCKVEDRPANANCATMPAADAYWGLFWSDGTSGHWVYSTVSVDGLKVASGGFVAFAWQASSSQRPPSVAPTRPRPAPSPSPTPTKQPTKKATKKPAAGAATSASPTASATADAATSPSASAAGTASAPTEASPSPSASATSSGAAAVGEPKPLDPTTADSSGSGGLAWWVPVLVLLALAGGGGAAWWTRRRGAP
jgi:hypothetical protein